MIVFIIFLFVIFSFKAIKKEVEGTMESRLQSIEQQLQHFLNHKIASFDGKIDQKIADVSASNKSVEGGGSWKFPFFLLILVQIGAAIGLYLFYQKLQKKHIL